MIKFAIFSDLHYDFIPDGQERLNDFIDVCNRHSLDFIMNLGDFCIPIKKNNHVLKKIQDMPYPCHHVLGNHDSDFYDKKDILNFFTLDNSYYSFQYNHVKFIVLDSCFTEVSGVYHSYNKTHYKESKGNYPIIPPIQLDWLKKELEDKHDHYVIFTHHSLENNFKNRGIHNKKTLQTIFKQFPNKSITCFNGHDHSDSHRVVDQRHYHGINAMSYIWLGAQCHLRPYSDDMYKDYPLLKDIILYNKALFAIVSIQDDGKLSIEGRDAGYRHISPEMLGLDPYWNGRKLSSKISTIPLK